MTESDAPLHQLIGTWRSDAEDSTGVRAYGDVSLKFGSDGTLLYIIKHADKERVIRLTFRVDGDYIVTDQPSQPHVERTKYELTSDGALILAFGGQKSRYIRAF